MSIKYLAGRFNQEVFEIIREEEMAADTDIAFIGSMDREGQRNPSRPVSSFAVPSGHLTQALVKEMEV